MEHKFTIELTIRSEEKPKPEEVQTPNKDFNLNELLGLLPQLAQTLQKEVPKKSKKGKGGKK